MIQVSNLNKAYGRQVLFDDVGFTVNAGERIGLVGRNGHGKTTLFRLILGQEKPDTGTISVPSGYTIGHLSQHIDFTRATILEEACLGLKPAEDGRDESYRAKAILMGLGFTVEDFSRPPRELSGGYQIRLNLGKLLASEPNLLLLDEPTNYLDILSIRWLIKFLRSWKGELILITHDRDFMDRVTTHTMGIHRAKIRKVAGPTQKLYAQLLMEEEIYEKTRVNDEKKRAEIEQFITRFRAKATKARAVQSKIKALGKRERLEQLAQARNLDFSFKAAPFTGKTLIDAREVSFSFEASGPPLIDTLSFSVGKDDRIAVIGKNGKGKTTLLNLLAGELMPRQGEIVRRQQLKPAYFGQTNIQRLSPAKTVEEEILDAMPDHNRRAARTICGIMMFEGDNALKKVSVLSGGERSRVLLGKLLVSPANLLLLDEPTNHLDMESVDSLLDALEAFEGAVVIVTHSEMILHALATRLIVFDDNRVSLFEGTYQDFLDRVGWKSEEAEERPSNSAGRNEGKSDNTSAAKKDMRRLRAELITERSRTLGGLQKRIAEIEDEIVLTEERIEADNAALLNASVTGDGGAIKALSKSLHEAKTRIDLLFGELATLTEALDAKTREFEERLEALKAE